MIDPPTLPITRTTVLQPGTRAPTTAPSLPVAGAPGAAGAKHDICGFALKSENTIGENHGRKD